jgi:hypothetical protein
MSIPANELADLIEQATAGAVPNEIEYTRRAANEIRKSGIGAFSDDTEAKSLLSMINAIKNELGEKSLSQIAQVEINSSQSSYINILPDYRGQVKRIIVFDGFKQFVCFHTYLIKVLDQLQVHRSEVQYKLPNGSLVNESLAFSIAGYSILSDFQKTRRLPVSIHDMLGPRARNDVIAAVCGALGFVLLHEIGHIELGHIDKSGVYSERQHFSLLEQEVLNLSKENEIAADKFAIGLIPHESRFAFMPSLIFLFGAYAFLEVFNGNLNEQHPLAVNRLSSIVDECEASPETKNIIISWIEQQRNSFKALEKDRINNNGSIRNRIEENMPVNVAYKILADIKHNVSTEYGLLDRDE